MNCARVSDGGTFTAEEGEDPAPSGWAGEQPSAREVAAAGLRSSRTAYHQLKKLEDYLARAAGRAKLIWLTDKRWEAAGLEVVAMDKALPEGAVIVALLRGGEEVTVRRIYREDGKLRLSPENGDHEEPVLPAEDARVQGRVVYVIQPPRKNAAGGGA